VGFLCLACVVIALARGQHGIRRRELPADLRTNRPEHLETAMYLGGEIHALMARHGWARADESYAARAVTCRRAS